MNTQMHASFAPAEIPVDGLSDIDVLTLSDLIRLGCQHTEQAVGSWGDGQSACTLSAAREELSKRGFIQ
jgi:hypothetical protein